MANLLSLNGKVVGGGAGGSGGGHAIENSSGTTLTQRDTLQFAGLNATDDSTSAKTVVDVFQDAMSLEDFEDAQSLGEGIYPITSDDSTVITADMVDYNGGTVSDVLDNIAPVETSTTASQAYAIGEQFILNGTLYTATAAITLGGTIVIDGNCTASDTVTEQINVKPTYTFLASTNLGGWNAKTITDLNEFKYIFIIISDGNIDRTSYFIPLSYFKTKNAANNYIGGYTYVTSSLVIGYGAFYNSDTQIYLNMSNTSYEIKVYGVK